MAGRQQGSGMTMNKKARMSAVLALAFGILFQTATVLAGAPEQADLSALLNRIGKKVSDFKTLKTDFVQEKKMALFREKLVLKGRIYLQKPNKVAWHVDKPLRYSVLITDKFIRQWDEDTDQVQELSLTKNPMFQNVIRQLTVWFSGEYGSLLETNDVRLVQRSPLAIEFSPRSNNDARKVIKNITVTFREDQTYLRQIRIQELSGDVTTISFTNTLLNAPLDDSDFEVHPVRKQSSRTIMDSNGMQLSLINVDHSLGDIGFSNGVNPVRKQGVLLSPQGNSAQLPLKDAADCRHERAVLSDGVTRHV
jgi:outer membrane lipoprotein-sorting protein